LIHVRRQRVRSVRYPRGTTEAKRLIAALAAANDHETRAPLRKRLAELGTVALPHLIDALRHEDDFMRWEAVNLLGETADDRALPSVLRFALSETEVHARWRSYWAVTRFDRTKTVPMLLRALRQRGPTRWPAALMLSMMDRPEAAPAILVALRSTDAWTQYEALSAVRSMKLADAVPSIAPFLARNRPVEHRQEAALALGAIASPRAARVLIRALKDPDPGVRWRASMGLGRSSSPVAADALRSRLERETDARVREQIRSDLKHHGRQKA
jgi:HEAT repeat protein